VAVRLWHNLTGKLWLLIGILRVNQFMLHGTKMRMIEHWHIFFTLSKKVTKKVKFFGPLSNPKIWQWLIGRVQQRASFFDQIFFLQKQIFVAIIIEYLGKSTFIKKYFFFWLCFILISAHTFRFKKPICSSAKNTLAKAYFRAPFLHKILAFFTPFFPYFKNNLM